MVTFEEGVATVAVRDEPQLRWHIYAVAAFTILIFSLLLGLLIPVYTDEIGWRFQSARVPFDGGVDRFVAEACGPNTIARPPLFMLPFRWLSAYLNLLFDSPAWVRIGGVAAAITWIVSLWTLLGQIGGALTARLRVLCLALAGLGVLPLLLIWSRPEQALLLTITIALIVATRAEATTERGSLAAAGTVLLVGLAALSYHLKGVVFLPTFIVAAAFSSSGKTGRYARVVTIAVLFACGAVALHYWTNRFACPADPVLAEQLGRQNIGAMILTYGYHDPLALARAALRNVSPLRYVDVALPARSYMSEWLPPITFSPELLTLWRRSIPITWAASLLLFTSGFALGLLTAVRTKRLPRSLVLAVVVGGVALVWAASQMIKNAYEATIILPMLTLAGALALASGMTSDLTRRLIAVPIALVALISMGSQGLLLVEYAPRLWTVSHERGGYVNEQPYSLAPWSYAANAKDVVAAGRLCGIGPESRPKAVLIDDLTYFSYIRSYRPQHRLGVLSNWNGAQADPIRYLRSKGSQGAVVGCRFLPSDLRVRAKAVGSICCIAPL